MGSKALTRTRVVVGTVMAAATVATAGMAVSLATARTAQQADDGAGSTTTPRAGSTTAPGSGSARTGTRKSTNSQDFTPTRTAGTSSGTSHSTSKGS